MNSIVTNRFIDCHQKLLKGNKVRSARQLALSLDYHPQSLSEILKGRRDVTIELLRKAIEKYDINPNFLFLGQQPMFLGELPQNDIRMLTIVTDGNNDERIVHVPVSAQAGYGGQLQNPVFFKELPNFSLPDYRFRSGTYRCFDISGDSMEPTLFSGDKVVCSYIPMEDWEHSVKNNFVYVVITKSDVLIKRVYNRISQNGNIELFSDNSYYNPYPLSVRDILEIWFVKIKISPFMPSPANIRNALHDEVDDLKNTIKDQSSFIRELNVTVEKLLRQNRVRVP